MKKNSLLKVILITTLLFIVLSWIIPGGLFYKGTFYKAENSVALGLGDIFTLPFQAFYLFAEYGVIFLLIGGMYGVFNKTGAYYNVVKKIASLFAKKKNLAIILTSIIILLFESIIGNNLLTFVLIPFFVSVLTELGFNKKRVMLATIGSLILGSFASTIGYGGLINYLFELNKKELLKVRLIILAVTFILMIVTLLIKNKNDKDEEKMEIAYEEGSKKGIGLTIIFIIFMLISIIGVYNFADFLGIKVFSNFSTNVLSKISILNGITALGSWGTREIAGMIIFTIFVTSIFYRIKFSSLIEGFKDGAKSMIKPSIYATLSGIIFMYYYNSSEGYNFIDTIVNFIYSSSGEYLKLKTAVATPIYLFLFNNQLFLTNNVAGIVSILSSNKTSIAASGLSLQLMSGVFNLIIPTSYVLMAGLAYFNISYGKWFKYIWKLLLVLIIISGIIIMA